MHQSSSEPGPQAPVRSPVDRARMLANVRHSLFEADDGVVRIGRYELRERLGAGAMGQVHLAFDPRLRREVALKVLTVETEAVAAAVTNEARALARIEHPCIVRVFDVGSSELGLFIAMERLGGIALGEWARSQTPSIRRRFQVLVEVARALAAAHEAGLVHRDVKPDNVLIEPDGRAVVVDFGLAVDVDVASGAAGTPAYMPPEQHDGGAATPAADQYAWAVMAWELLYGSRPFASDDSATLLAQKQAESLPARPPHTQVPARAWEVLRRGLAPDARDRWSSMGALLNALEPVVRPGRQWRWVLGIAAVGVCTVAVGWIVPKRDVEDVCAPMLDWGESRPIARAAIVDQGGELGDELWTQLSKRVDGAVEDYADSRSRVCSGGRTEPEAVACLWGWSKRFEVVASSLETVGADDVPDVLAWTLELGDPARCEDHEASSILGPAPPSRIREEVEEVRGGLERARALFALSSMTEAKDLLEDLLGAAERLGFEPLIAEVLDQHARVLWHSRETEMACVELERAHGLALRSRHDYIRARSAAKLAQFQLLSTGDVFEATTWLRRARAVDASRWPIAEFDCLQSEALLSAWSEADASISIQARAIEVAASVGPQKVLAAKLRLAQLLVADRQHAQGYALASEVLKARVESHGLHHRSNAKVMLLLGVSAGELGRYDEADRVLAEAVNLQRRVSGPGSVQVASMQIARAKMLNLREDWSAAHVAEDSVAASLVATPDHEFHIALDILRGQTRLGQGRLADAEELFNRARVAAEQRFGTESADTGWVLRDLGRAQLALGNIREARSTLEQAWALVEPGEPRPDRDLSILLFTLAMARAADGGRLDQARALAQRARREADGDDPASAALRVRIDAWLAGLE